MGRSETFSIRQMVELTGLSEFTIRGWETRYNAFRPARTETGRREYRKGDVERALLLREVLKRGHKIGKAAKLDNQKLKELFGQTEAPSRDEGNAGPVARAMELVALQKWTELKLLIDKLPTRNTGRLIHEFLLPALKELAENVKSGLVSISQEHVFSSFLKEKIYSALSDLETGKGAAGAAKKIRFVLATPEGDYHEIGLLLAHLLIRSRGMTSLYLGPHSPARELSETALRFGASHLLIVSTVARKGGARQDLLSFVSDVQRRIGPQLQILIAGSQAPSIARDPASSLFSLGGFPEFEEYLQELGGRP